MFEYDRLALNVAEHILKTSSPQQQLQQQYRPCSQSESLVQRSRSDRLVEFQRNNNFRNSQFQNENCSQSTTENSSNLITRIATGRKSSAPTQINELIKEFYQHAMHQQQQHNPAMFSPKSIDGENMRRLSGGSNSYGDCGTIDCGASSGYGSPGMGGTPLASPAPNSAYYIAHNLHRMLEQEQTVPGRDQAGSGNDSQDALTMFMSSSPFGDFSDNLYNNIMDEFDWKKLCCDHDSDQDLFFGFLDDVCDLPNSPNISSSMLHGSHGDVRRSYLSSVNFPDQKDCGNSDGKLSATPSDGGSTAPTMTPTSGGNVPAAAMEDGFSPAEIAQFAQLLCSPKKAPPQRYQCHICYQSGHYISDCPMRFNSPYEELTPYQGRKKCYGEFQCQLCKRKWTSQNSVANEAQSCIKCHVPVFPHKQLPVDKAIALGLVKSHRVVPTKITPIGHGRPPNH